VSESKQPDLVIYHGNCTDGFTAAYAAWTVQGNTAEYVPSNHAQAHPDVTGRRVAVLDYAYDRPTTQKMIKAAKSYEQHDHHADAYARLHGICQCHFCFDKSGAGMAWDRFRPGEEMPRLVKIVQANDLRQFTEEGRAIRSYVQRVDQTFENWQDLHQRLDDPVEYRNILDEAYPLLEKDRTLVAGFAEPRQKFSVGAYSGYIASVPHPYYGADTADHLAELAHKDGLPGALGVTWRMNAQRPDMVQGSVRSGDSRVDCSFVANKLFEDPKAGGHAAASGFNNIPLPKWGRFMKKVTTGHKPA